MRKDLGYEFCRAGLREEPARRRRRCKRTDCSLVSDGAAALVLTDTETALAMQKAVSFRAAVQVNDFLPMRARHPRFEGRAGLEAGARRRPASTLADLSFVETHDCFTIAELIEYEAMGLAPRRAGRARDARGLDRRRMAGCRSIRPAG